jgi:hypothetical protein
MKYSIFLRFDVQSQKKFLFFCLSINYSQKRTKKAHEKKRDKITTGEAHFAVEVDNDNVVVKVDVKTE